MNTFDISRITVSENTYQSINVRLASFQRHYCNEWLKMVITGYIIGLFKTLIRTFDDLHPKSRLFVVQRIILVEVFSISLIDWSLVSARNESVTSKVTFKH